MLLVSRRLGEAVVVNGGIEITVVAVQGNRVKLGFKYPQGNTVYRKELFEKIQEENQAAVRLTSDIASLLKALPEGAGRKQVAAAKAEGGTSDD